jgi:AcrR family transcriptional regulator
MMVALDLFSKRDFSATTIKDIGKAASLNTALIYYYFDSKEDLFRAAIEYATRTALENYRDLRDRCRDPVALIEDWFDNNLELADSIRKLVKIMLDYSNAPERLPSVDDLIAEFYREETGLLANGICEGIAQGLFRDVNADQLALFASVHLDGIMAASMIRRDFDIAKAIADLKHLVWSYLDFHRDASDRHRKRVVRAVE